MTSPNSPPSGKPKILIIGGTGMLGHKIVQRLTKSRPVAATIRDQKLAPEYMASLAGCEIISGVDAHDLTSVSNALDRARPSVVINCVGVIKQVKEAYDPVIAISVNALFPHLLALETAKRGIRLIHFGTDCVFSGATGFYREDDIPDATDLYGRTKLLGEVSQPGVLTIRSSIVGHELHGHRSLFDWMLSQRGGRIKGFSQAYYSGLGTVVMAALVERIIDDWADLHGIWQVASERIDKYTLLTLMNEVYNLNVTIDRDETFKCDRSLDGSRFAASTGWRAPSWPEMIQAIYSDWRDRHEGL